jgi:hypothetical protein
MRSQKLINLAKDTDGWHVAPLLDDDGNQYRDRCMVKKGALSKLVVVEEYEEETVDYLLEKKVIGVIKELVEKDKMMMLRETVIFSAMGMALVGQAQQFVGLVKYEGKMKLKTATQHIEKLSEQLQKDFMDTNIEQMAPLLDGLEDATHRVHQKFGDAIIAGKLPAFIDHIQAFNTEEEKKPKKKTSKLKKVE